MFLAEIIGELLECLGTQVRFASHLQGYEFRKRCGIVAENWEFKHNLRVEYELQR